MFVYAVLEFAVEWIPGVKKKKQKLSSVQKTACITAIANKEMIIVFCISGVLCRPTSVCCSIEIVSSA